MSKKFRLSVMMFLQYAIWGAWLPILWPFLAGYRGFDPGQITNMFAVGAVGALLAPFVAGQIADRYFATEKFLAVSHLLGALLMWQLAGIATYTGFLVFSVAYSLIYAPTLSLTNSICFHHIKDRDKDFGWIRVWGTIGWIVVGLGVGQWLKYEYTPSKEEAAQWIVEHRFLDAKGRQECLEFSRITLHDNTVLIGEIVEESRSTVVLAKPDDGDTTALAREDVETIVPMIELTARDGQAAALGDAIHRVAREPGQAAAVARDLVESRLLSDEAWKEPVLASYDRGRADAFRLSAMLGVVLGLFCFLLPHTPPQGSRQSYATAAALARIRNNPLLTLFLLAVPVSCIHQFYFVHTADFLSRFPFDTDWIDAVFGVGGGGMMTVGQIAEILVLSLIPLFAKKFSRKTFLAIGLLAYTARMAIFAYVAELEAGLELSPAVLLMSGVALHGLCFGCFVFVSFMIVDEQTSGDVRASAQSLYNLVMIGVGIIVGSKIAGWVAEWATIDQDMNYTKLFSVPMWAAAGCLLVLLLFYPRRVQAAAEG